MASFVLKLGPEHAEFGVIHGARRSSEVGHTAKTSPGADDAVIIGPSATYCLQDSVCNQ